MITEKDSYNEFEYDNYIRIALYDWNYSILALFCRSVLTRVPFRTKYLRKKRGMNKTIKFTLSEFEKEIEKVNEIADPGFLDDLFDFNVMHLRV